jgi:hypothetical protein
MHRCRIESIGNDSGAEARAPVEVLVIDHIDKPSPN